MAEAARAHYANPASAHTAGAAASRALEVARGEVAGALDVEPEELVFTSGGTEADALGLLGAARAARGRHVVVSALEHPAVMRAAEALVAAGGTLDVVPPGPDGVVRAQAVAAAVRPDTAVVAIMLVQNEIGTVQPIAEIARLLGPRAPPPPAPARRRRASIRPPAPAPAGAGRRQPRPLRAQAARSAGRRRALGPAGRACRAALGRRRPGTGTAGRHREPAGDRRVRAGGRAGPPVAGGRRRRGGGDAAGSSGSRRAGGRRGRAPDGERRSARASHRLAGLPGASRRAAAARARGARACWRPPGRPAPPARPGPARP